MTLGSTTRLARCARAGARWALTGLAWLTVFGGAAQAAPAAGSQLENTARATYFDTDRGFNASLASNTVSITVQALEALTLTSDNSLLRSAGGVATLPHRLTNTGNTSSTYVLRFANRSNDDHDLLGLHLVWDRNGNGVADSGEPTLDNGATFGPLASGEFADFVLVGSIANGVPNGQVARTDFSARSVLQGAAGANIDSVTVAEGALLHLHESTSNAGPKVAEIVTLTLTAGNSGNRSASGLPVLVDGGAMSLVLMRALVPANATLVAAGAPGAALLLYHLQGQPEHSYSRSPPVDLRQVDALAFGFAAELAPGPSLTRSLNVRINANAAGPVTALARLLFTDGLHAQPMAVESNLVRMVVTDQPPVLRLFADPQYTRPIAALAAGQPFYVGFNASRCNLDPLRAETQMITVSSSLAGDIESFIATETGPNTGDFHIEPFVSTVDALRSPLVRGDGQLSVKPNDRLTVSVTGCGATQMEASLLVDPFGTVFDSKTSAPIAGAVVSLLDITGAGNGGHPGALARVFLADALTPAPSVLTTGADGEYRFPLVAPSVYRLHVAAPSPYTFASILAASLLPAERVVDAGSYGNPFTITALSEPVHLDIPLDADSRAGFFIEKTASRKTVELGEFVDYQVKVKNVTGQLLGRVRITDRLPAGFAYLRGSARLLDAGSATTRLDRSALPEPEGGGSTLVFNVGSINDGALLTLSYRVRVGPGALQGNGINLAQATSAGPLPKLSNESRATVQVLPGVFGDRGFLVGNVFADCNANRERDADEPGIAGVRLFLEDGTSVTTDRLGRYSLYGLKPQTHVLKLDRSSLPFSVGAPGEAKLELLANRNAGDAGSRFIDMKKGEMQRADFAVTGCSDAQRSALAMRAESVARTDESAETVRDSRLAADPRLAPVVDAKALPASGRVGASSVAPAQGAPAALASSVAAQKLPAPPTPPTPASREGRLAAEPAALPILSDEAISALDNRLAVLFPTDAQVLGYAQTTVTVKGALGAALGLRINGVLLAANRIGRIRTVEAQALQVVEYVGVDLKPGSNTLTLEQSGETGAAADKSERAPTITVTAPGALAQLRLSAPGTALPADGRSRIRVTIEPLDAAGVAVTAPTPVTLNASRGRWQLRDLDPDEPGVQVFIEGGRLVAELESPSEPGDVLVQVASGNTRAQVKLGFNAELRPLIGAGIVEGVFNLRRLNRSAVQPARAQDGFEQALTNVAGRIDGGSADASARATFFLKGKVLGDTLLTLAYDSDKVQRERLFRDIQPGEFYPVYGDDSVKGFDAQSTGRLYVRLDRARSFMLYGDFNTQADAALTSAVNARPGIGASGGAGGAAAAIEERRLGQYNRSLNGLRTHLESDDGSRSLSAFASQTSSRQVVDELPALGTSGPYALSRAPLVENSEKLELLTRDRSQNALIVRSVALTRFVDYELETLTGRILLKAPLASLDAGFNPNSLRITYEVEQGSAKSWVGGVSARVEVSDQLVVGVGVVRDSDPQHPLNLQSAGAVLRLAPGIVVAAEAARSETPLGTPAGSALGAAAGTALTSGMAARIELRVDAERLQVQAQIVRASAGFENPSASVTKGRQETTAKASYKAGEQTTLKAELLRSADLPTAVRRTGAQLALEHAVNESVRVELALRHSGGAEPGTSAVAIPTTTVLAKVSAQVPGVPRASVFAEAEQDVADASRHVAALGGEYRLDSATRLYGRYEFISSLGSRYGLNDAQQRNATVLGVQTDYMTDANLFSEYRLRDALDGRQAEAAIGLRNRWKLGGGWSASTGYERVRSLNGSAANVGSGETTAVNGGLEYSGASDWKGMARLELRDSTAGTSVLSTLGAAFKLSDEWTALGRNLLTITRQHNAASKTEDWLQFGMAYREQAANKTNVLLRAEYRINDVTDPVTGDSGHRVAVVSAHASQQLNAQTQLSARVAAKWARDRSLGLDSRETTQLLSARATHDIAPRWDLGLQTAALIGASGHARQFGLGVEAGHMLADNLWVSVGWNVFGFTDRDLTAQDNTRRGFYIRLRFKFDEALF